MLYKWALKRCNPWPHVRVNISISRLLSLWRHSHYAISCLRRSWRSQPPFSLWRGTHSPCSHMMSLWLCHCDVIRYWAGHAHRYGPTYVTDTLPRLIYRDLLTAVSTSTVECVNFFLHFVLCNSNDKLFHITLLLKLHLDILPGSVLSVSLEMPKTSAAAAADTRSRLNICFCSKLACSLFCSPCCIRNHSPATARAFPLKDSCSVE